ncbi:MAG: NfeD family protein [Prevotella sp.]|nr:NfeD family protein [Prevotella sp.]
MIDYLIQNLWLAWLLAGIVCLILEMMNGDFFIMCFAIGGFCASAVSVFTDSVTVQVVLFALFTLLSIFFVRPIALRYLHRGEDRRLSNADALIGREGKVTDTIEAGGYGRVKIDGDSWKARSADGDEIRPGTDVRILRLDSIIATVEPC